MNKKIEITLRRLSDNGVVHNSTEIITDIEQIKELNLVLITPNTD